MSETNLTIGNGTAELKITVPTVMDTATAKGVIQQMTGYVKMMDKNCSGRRATKLGITGLKTTRQYRINRWDDAKVKQFMQAMNKCKTRAQRDKVAESYDMTRNDALKKMCYYRKTRTASGNRRKK